MERKRVLGQFFTKENVWLKPQIENFITSSGTSVAYDPFAGNGDLLRTADERLRYEHLKGLDIDSTLNWCTNDSLVNIPHIDNAIIITNPPYISNYSASRRNIADKLKLYFDMSDYDDVYLIALDRMIEAQDFIVAIIPETFINSPYRQKHYLHSLTILEDNPFVDTDTPVLVACFDGTAKSFDEIKVYKNEKYINTLGYLDRCRIKPSNTVKIRFNDIDGWLGVRCVDTTSPDDMVRFGFKENFNYNWDKGIKVSSRLLTLLNLEVIPEKRAEFIDTCNMILNRLREQTDDLILSPFKGNMKNGRRRRRLDFLTCRAIIEQAFEQTFPKGNPEVR